MHGIVEDTTISSGSTATLERPARQRRRQKPVRLCDVATAANVSIATVSLVLSGNPRIGLATQQRVRGVAQSLGYRPVRSGQPVIERTSTTLAVLMPAQGGEEPASISDAYFGELVAGISDHASAAGYNVLFERASAEFLRRRQHVALLEERAAAGLFLIGFTDHHRFIDDLDTDRHPVVVVDNKLDRSGGDIDFVGCDYRAGAQQAMNYLLQVGHRKIGLLISSSGGRNVRDIVAVYRAAMSGCGARPGEGYIADGQFTEKHGHAATEKIFRRHSDVTAILCACDNMAIGAMRAAIGLGRSVPRDLSIVGFGNFRQAAFLNPTLTTVQLPLREVGIRACQRVLEHIAGERKAVANDLLPTHLVLRGSTALAGDSSLKPETSAA